MHAESPTARFLMESHPRRPGDRNRYATDGQSTPVDVASSQSHQCGFHSRRFLIQSPGSWDDVTRTLLDATEGRASDIRYVKSRDAVTDKPSSIEVVRTALTGDADYEIEVHWKNQCRLGDDAVAYRIAGALGTPVVLPNRDVEPYDWLLVTHDGDIYTPIVLDVELMERNRRIAYRRA